MNFLTQDIDNWYSTLTHYAKYDLISGQNKKSETEISHQQSIVTEKYKRICTTVLKFFHVMQ